MVQINDAPGETEGAGARLSSWRGKCPAALTPVGSALRRSPLLLPQLCGALRAGKGAAPLAQAKHRREEGEVGECSARTAPGSADLVQNLRAQSQALPIHPPLQRHWSTRGLVGLKHSQPVLSLARHFMCTAHGSHTSHSPVTLKIHLRSFYYQVSNARGGRLLNSHYWQTQPFPLGKVSTVRTGHPKQEE